MGAASLKGLQLFDRILIMFMPVKYQPDYMFLRQVRKNEAHFQTDRLSLSTDFFSLWFHTNSNWMQILHIVQFWLPFTECRFHWNVFTSSRWFNLHVSSFCGWSNHTFTHRFYSHWCWSSWSVFENRWTAYSHAVNWKFWMILCLKCQSGRLLKTSTIWKRVK